ncbi:MAG: hypothetical protein MI784_02460 [Cytophagales bacterium]|nr:hypothetical protein [Cytophagales bacterium]
MFRSIPFYTFQDFVKSQTASQPNEPSEMHKAYSLLQDYQKIETKTDPDGFPLADLSFYMFNNRLPLYEERIGETQDTIQQRMRILWRLEKLLWQILHKYLKRPASDPQKKDFVRVVNRLINDTAKEYQGCIGMILEMANRFNKIWDPWLEGLENLSFIELVRRLDLWRSLIWPRESDKLHVIDDTRKLGVPPVSVFEGYQFVTTNIYPGFNAYVHSMHAKLLSLPEGRQLLNFLAKGKHEVWVGPRQHNVQTSEMEGVEPGNPRHAQPFLFGGQQPASFSGSSSTQKPHEASPPLWREAGRGTGSLIRLDPLPQEGRTAVPVSDTIMPEPSFIHYASMLTEALLNQKGLSTANVSSVNPWEQDRWKSDQQDHIVSGFENPIRVEHGLPPRISAEARQIKPSSQPEFFRQGIRGISTEQRGMGYPGVTFTPYGSAIFENVRINDRRFFIPPEINR